MKYEWKKEEKEIYLPKEIPTLITIPKLKYFTITGKGNPNNKDFSDRIGVLYSLAYAVGMSLKILKKCKVFLLIMAMKEKTIIFNKINN